MKTETVETNNFPCQQKEWNRFCKEGLKDGELVADFGKMSKKFGLAFLHYLSCSWVARGEISKEEFQSIHKLPEKVLNAVTS